MFKSLNFSLKVFFTKLFKGEYSYQYVALFKNHDLRSPFTPCIKDEFLFHILMFLKRNPKVKVFKTNESIQFGNTAFSMKYSEIFKMRGVPNCFNALKLFDYEITIIGYQDTIQNSKIKSVYYFANEVFILAEYTFSDATLTESINISKILIDKYISESTKDLDEFFIEDSNKNSIYFNDNGFEVSVKYLNNEIKESKKIYNDLAKLMLKTEYNSKDLENHLSDLL